jgi:hypothetical protein
MSGMQIHFVQSGGIGGLKLVADVDTAELPSAETSTLEQLVDAALADRREGSMPSRLRDDLKYEVQVTRDGTTKSLRASEGELTPSLEALIKTLAERALPSR